MSNPSVFCNMALWQTWYTKIPTKIKHLKQADKVLKYICLKLWMKILRNLEKSLKGERDREKR